VTVVHLPAPDGVVRPLATEEARPAADPAELRLSSPDALAGDAGVPQDATAEAAARLGVHERALRTAQEMLRRHVAAEHEGPAGQLTAVVDGVRVARLTGLGLIVQAPDEALQRVAVALVADPLVLLAVAGLQRELHWSLLPGGPSVTSRADGLRLIRSLAAGGQLRFQFGSSEPFPPFEFDEAPWDNEDEWRLFEDLAALEEWSGATIPMPGAVSADEATTAAQAASWARTQRIDTRLTGAITFSAAADASLADADELRLHQAFGVELLHTAIPLGEGVARVGLRGVERLDGDKPTFRAVPEHSVISFSLHPPASRRLPPRRTQPERLSPPAARPTAGRDPSRSPPLVRRAARQLSAVLAEQPPRTVPELGHSGGTARLLDDIRGE
jgi:hypothetical protein